MKRILIAIGEWTFFQIARFGESTNNMGVFASWSKPRRRFSAVTLMIRQSKLFIADSFLLDGFGRSHSSRLESASFMGAV